MANIVVKQTLYLMKVYSLLSLNGNLENFQMTKESNTLVTVYWCIGTFVALYLPIRVWGIVYLCSGHSTTFVQIN